MLMSSSPFRASTRRSRSHTSLSSPSSSPISRSDKHHSHPALSPLLIGSQQCASAAAPFIPPLFPASALAAQPPEKWDVEAWRRGKRARRDFESPSEDADMESCDEPSPSSPLAESQSLSNPLSMSAPSTPHPRFAMTSDAFQFFPAKSSPLDAKQPASSPASCGLRSVSHTHGQHVGGLEQMHSDAFDELRKTVWEAGEGFVRRMREFEAHRNTGTSRVNALSSHPDGSGYKVAYYKRGRKRPSPLSARQRSRHRVDLGSGRGNASDSEDGVSDVEIRSTSASGLDESRAWSPSKKRAVSLTALSYQGSMSAAQSRSLPFPIPLRNRERSSSPSESVYSDSSSDEDEEIASSSGNAADRLRHRGAMRFRSKHLSNAKYSPPPLSFSFSTSNNSSHLSLGASAPSPISLNGGTVNALSSSPTHPNLSASAGSARNGPENSTNLAAPRTSNQTDKAVAALSLALANGAGSVSDYEALRGVQGVLPMEVSEAGSLWD